MNWVQVVGLSRSHGWRARAAPRVRLDRARAAARSEPSTCSRSTIDVSEIRLHDFDQQRRNGAASARRPRADRSAGRRVAAGGQQASRRLDHGRATAGGQEFNGSPHSCRCRTLSDRSKPPGPDIPVAWMFAWASSRGVQSPARPSPAFPTAHRHHVPLAGPRPVRSPDGQPRGFCRRTGSARRKRAYYGRRQGCHGFLW